MSEVRKDWKAEEWQDEALKLRALLSQRAKEIGRLTVLYRGGDTARNELRQERDQARADLDACQRDFAGRVKRWVDADTALLRAALEAVPEYVIKDNTYLWVCPCCHKGRDAILHGHEWAAVDEMGGHAPDCPRQTALEQTQEPEKELERTEAMARELGEKVAWWSWERVQPFSVRDEKPCQRPEAWSMGLRLKSGTERGISCDTQHECIEQALEMLKTDDAQTQEPVQ